MLQADLIMLVTSEKKPNKTVCTIVNEEKQVETHDRDENFILPSIDSYKLRVGIIFILGEYLLKLINI